MAKWKNLLGKLRGPGDDAPSGEEEQDILTISQLVVPRQGRRRADALAERIIGAVCDAPGITPHDLAEKINESQIVVVTEVDHLVRENQLRFDRSAGTVFPASGGGGAAVAGSEADKAAVSPKAAASHGKNLLALFLLRLFRDFREVPGARIEATTHGLQLFVREGCMLQALRPPDGDFLWVEHRDPKSDRTTIREQIGDVAALELELNRLRQRIDK